MLLGMGWSEILLIVIVILVLVHPEQVPSLARQLGLWMISFKKLCTSFQDEIDYAIDSVDSLEEKNKICEKKADTM